MNNVVTILIDSVMWECTGTKRTSKTTTPFMDSLHSEGITASELYSHGPYTDAATKSLYTGRNCLDDFSYFYRLNSAPNNHFKAFHDAGYETYGLYYPYFTIGNKIKEYIDHTFYSAGFIFKSEWGGIFSYYASIYKNRDLYENEVAILELRTKLMFECWLTFYKDVQESSESIFLIKKLF
jgi:arylsulfatase A-like enzyme